MTDRLHAIDVALRICNIELNNAILEKVVKIVDLINELGEEATLRDLVEINKNNKNGN